jgi:hypothetical protein
VKTKTPKEILVKTNPPSSSSFMQASPINPPHDVLVQMAPNVSIPPLVRPGALISCFGKYVSMDANFVITF